MQTYEDGILRIMRFGPLGPYANNAYIIADSRSGEAIIVDMPIDSEELLAETEGLRIGGILLTHTHSDHWAAYDLVKGATGAPVHCHPAEQLMPAEKIDRPLADGEVIAVGGLSIRAIHTPGHTPGSTCLLVEDRLISGDTLFPGGPGRTSTNADLQQSIQSITSKLFELPDDIVIHPGHGDDGRIGDSKREYEIYASKEHPGDLCGDVNWEES